MKIQGYIRFSYLGKTDTGLSAQYEGDRDALFRAVFDPLRMERRFHLFERLCLPGLKQQTDQEFSIIIIASTDMPDVYKRRLEAATSEVPQSAIKYSKHPTVLHAVRPTARRFVEETGGNSIHFRLDDDDVLGKDAIAQIKEYGKQAEPGTILSLKFGYRIFKISDRVLMVPESEPFHSVGWARVNGPGDFRSPFKFGHKRAAQRFPTIQITTPASYVYTMHEESDTDAWNSKFIDRLRSEQPKLLSNAYQTDLAEVVDAAFPALGFDGLRTALRCLPNHV